MIMMMMMVMMMLMMMMMMIMMIDYWAAGRDGSGPSLPPGPAPPSKG